jgi:hypothetical protein
MTHAPWEPDDDDVRQLQLAAAIMFAVFVVLPLALVAAALWGVWG